MTPQSIHGALDFHYYSVSTLTIRIRLHILRVCEDSFCWNRHVVTLIAWLSFHGGQRLQWSQSCSGRIWRRVSFDATGYLFQCIRFMWYFMANWYQCIRIYYPQKVVMFQYTMSSQYLFKHNYRSYHNNRSWWINSNHEYLTACIYLTCTLNCFAGMQLWICMSPHSLTLIKCMLLTLTTKKY